MKRRIILTLIIALLMVQPIMPNVATEGDTNEISWPTPGGGLDGQDDIKMPQIDTGDATVNAILNFVLSIMDAVIEVCYDAFIKAPLFALLGAWGTVYKALVNWNIAAPMAWTISTLLFVAVGVVIIWLLATAMDWIM